jgi:threonine dehydrogenase-like Zn-dependent dehydrogenase
MRALRRSKSGVALESRVAVEPGAGEVRVWIAAAGICRTDLYVADGSIAIETPVVLGHEAAGWIDAVGPKVSAPPGELVAINPVLGCGRCRTCRGGRRELCQGAALLGVDRDGAFADAVVVPAAAVIPMPAAMDPRRAAYLEPVAASLAVTEAAIDPGARILVAGAGRIARLTARVLAACGHRSIARAPRPGDAEGADFDVAIETGVSDSLDPLIAAVRPGGLVVLKSRPAAPVAIDLRLAVSRRVTLQAVSYGRFAAAADLLISERLELEDLFGPSHSLDDWERALDAAGSDESRKHFFAIGASI